MLAGMRLYKPQANLAALPGLVPIWPAPARVKAFMSTRAGGVSPPPWASLNLGVHVGDEPQRVAHNRAMLQSALGVRPVFLEQVHGTQVLNLTVHEGQGLQADACITATPGLACTIMVADCLPVLLCDSQGRWVAAAHAGWRGLADGVLETLVQTAQERGTSPGDMLAWLGPCIGPAAFQVGTEVRQVFLDRDASCGHRFRPDLEGKWLADLPGLARDRLARLGVQQVHGHTGQPEWCTVSDASRFFSHRRDARVLGASGRMAALIWLEG
jgi:YfiH family protein